ncbi:MAG: hypothetical protein RL226_840 [Bacteroidota bacterium]
MTRFIILLPFLISVAAQSQTDLDLDTYLEAVVTESFGVELAQSAHQQARSSYKVFSSEMLPQVRLNANLPTYSRTSTSVVQPNGSISFQPLNQNLASVTLSATQPVGFTGGQLFIEAGLDRFDDFGRSFSQYNGVPFRIGYAQSLVGFNAYKWQRKIEASRLNFAEKQKIAAINAAITDATNLYFNALIANTNLALAESNCQLNEKLLILAEERYQLGKISLEEKLQMEAEFKLSTLQVAQAKKEVNQANLSMSAILMSAPLAKTQLKAPDAFVAKLPSSAELKALAMENAVDVNLNSLELNRWREAAARRRAENGIQLQVYAASGLVRSGSQISDIYTSPFSEQQIQASISVPLVDWGRRSAIKSNAKEQVHVAELTLEQTKLNVQSMVDQLILDMEELSTRLALQSEILTLSEQRYTINTERYTAGKITLTEWVLAQRNRDQAKRDYLVSLRDFYLAYCTLRSITGYDIRTQSTPTYQTTK